MCLNELPLRDISCRSQQQVTDSFPILHSSHPPTSLMTDDIFSNYLLRPFFALLVAPSSLHMYMCDVNTLVVRSTRSSIQPPLVSPACLSPLVKVGRIYFSCPSSNRRYFHSPIIINVTLPTCLLYHLLNYVIIKFTSMQ